MHASPSQGEDCQQGLTGSAFVLQVLLVRLCSGKSVMPPQLYVGLLALAEMSLRLAHAAAIS